MASLEEKKLVGMIQPVLLRCAHIPCPRKNKISTAYDLCKRPIPCSGSHTSSDTSNESRKLLCEDHGDILCMAIQGWY
ncbi:hypothetical protein H112_08307 [Trichophyton rubrum D6]|uniref:Uncharacterized protein n=2 Tax=Trichophyton TaxID=5550 RepID=A0A022VPU3_TRIRU|nr:hypothetical protein H100_08329 [Trichophyton rubrum MR850]EZF37338.1 hypothetical protein H102_08289 [Trichophyton rubrum CBS 100081]EZF47964.1 hypothetical protein H103_08312 [Trichophyton rubrum CBS 288.86]EZF58584.1 hypothetical protein H104_08262 [Trichophyton rubrum CBS 289.86]EZF69164.1 hypothetical protein H105_08316 [Trichophyton soudanense CBS 452.61]EZF79856.1 hypothetical protein H110_08312 [Trichophyton rubrum MR1448]EZF90477.1 hypothetical protein H113_08381 [Trichophyton rub